MPKRLGHDAAGASPKPLLLVAVVLLAVSGCGDDDSTDGGERSVRHPEVGQFQQTAAGPKEAAERSGRALGSLVITPASPEPGETIRVAVKNSGEQTLYFGLANRIQRRLNGRWADVTENVYGTRTPAVRDILLTAAPGAQVGPIYNENVTDRIPLPRALKPGIYRVVKRVSRNTRRGTRKVELVGTFEV